MSDIDGGENKRNARLWMFEEKNLDESDVRRLVKAKEIARKIKSFDHFIYVWGQKGQYYLPPKNVITWHYVSQILAQEKKLLKMEEVGSSLEVPKVRGTVVNEMFRKVKMENGLHLYFPDFTDTQNVPRDYFFNVGVIRY